MFATVKAQSAAKAQSTAKPQAPVKPRAAKSNGDSDSKPDKPATADKTSTRAGSSNASKAVPPSQPADNVSPADNSVASDAAATGSSANGNSTANGNPTGAAKNRASPRGAAAKPLATQTNDTTAAAGAEDPSADASNASGLSLLQLLAQSLEGNNSAVTSADAAPSDPTTDKTTTDSSHEADPNALVLAMLSQAFAGGFAAPPAATTVAATPTAQVTASETTGTAAVVTDATGASNSTSQLASLLVQGLVADARGKTDADATRSAVAATKSPDTAAADKPAVTPDSVAQSLTQLGTASHFVRDSHVAEIKAPVGSPAWRDEVGAQLTWMTQRGLESGSLRVSPEHLGPVEVQISIQNGDASVWFGASHPDTRAALEQALPQLREMFASQGMTLADTGVSRESPRRQTQFATPQSASPVTAVGSSEVTTAVRAALGLVDTYA